MGIFTHEGRSQSGVMFRLFGTFLIIIVVIAEAV